MRHLLLVLVASGSTLAAAADREAILAAAVSGREALWQRVQARHLDVASRDLFTYSLVLAEADQQLERIPALLSLAAEMQDRDPASRGYGNFHWRLRETEVLDFNAVDFCMMPGALLWRRHAERLPEPVREQLRALVELAAEGCRRHRVQPSYTNIALMNATDLVLLGEALGRADLADEGYARLESVCLYTLRYGIHEYNSPTYTGVDLEVLEVLGQHAERELGRRQAEAMLRLLWRSVALNWFAPSRRLGGTRSRDYDYLRGLGLLNTWAARAGLSADGGAPSPYWAMGAYRPEPALLDAPVPRVVRERFGPNLGAARTHEVFADVSLSSSAMTYGNMDLPLTVDLPGERTTLRGYFIADGREDPYGKKVIPAGNHQKTLHLTPFFTAAQQDGEALGLVVYRPNDVPAGTTTLQSHFVLPATFDWVSVAGRRLTPAEITAPLPVDAGGVVFRYGSALVGLRVPWVRGADGAEPRIELVREPTPHQAIRLTVNHHGAAPVASTGFAGALFWVKVASQAAPADDATWIRELAVRPVTVIAEKGVRAETGGLVVAVREPYIGPAELVPQPTRGVLELNGVEIGRAMLQTVEPMASWRPRETAAPPVALGAEPLLLQAESGWVEGDLRVAEDAAAGGGRYVWAPGEPGLQGGGLGATAWRLNVATAGRWYLWARVLTPTPDDDSYFLRIGDEGAEPVSTIDWHLGVREGWTWVPFTAGLTEPAGLDLPTGSFLLELSIRENGAKLDALWMTRDPAARPPE